MLGIEFGNQPIQVAGIEFMDFQTPTVYRGLVQVLDKYIEHDGKSVIFDQNNDALVEIQDYIMATTGIKVVFQDGNEVGNAAIESGYFFPNNLLNNKGIDDWYDVKYTNVAQAFKTLRADVIKGTVDTSTGKVGGDFSDIDFRIWVQPDLSWFLNHKVLAKKNVTSAEALAAIILHELGHAFTAMLVCYQDSLDSLFPLAAIRMAVDAKSTKEKITIVKDSLKHLECSTTVKDSDIEKIEDAAGFKIYFDKAIETRNLRRTLSLGVTGRSSESYADLYAMRMGAGKELIVVLSSMGLGKAPLWVWTFILGYSMIMTGNLMLGPWPGLIVFLVLGFIVKVSELCYHLAPDAVYDTPYRRGKAILREMIARARDDKMMSAKDKRQLLDEIKIVSEAVEAQKHFLEGTAVQRLLGWITSGSDFKAQDFENYTQDLLAHEISLYTDFFKTKD